MRIVESKLFEGKNIYCLDPVVKFIVDLEKFDGIETKQIEGFNYRLLKLLPGLREHYCSRGRQGGFVERLIEGTYFGHVLEHIALELQSMIGHQLHYGKTRRTNQPGCYEIILESDMPEVTCEAVVQGIRIIGLLTLNQRVSLPEVLCAVQGACAQGALGPSSAAIRRAAVHRKIPVMHLGEGVLQLGYGKHQVRVGATLTGRTSCLAADLVGDKAWTREYLWERGIPVPSGRKVNNLEEAHSFVQEVGFPVVLKPRFGHHGDGVMLQLANEHELSAAFATLQNRFTDIVIEQHIPGYQYRLVVVGNKLVAAAERIPPAVLGDGQSTIQELIKAINGHPLRGQGHELPLTKIQVDDQLRANLTKQGYHLESVPESGVKVSLYWQANLSKGAISRDVTETVHPTIAQLVCRAVQLVGLDVAGVDLVCQDISVPLGGQGAIIEINAAPGIRMHQFPAEGVVRDVGGAIVDWLMPLDQDRRIPVISVTGTNGKTTTVRMLGHILGGTDRIVGMATSDGIYIGKQKIVSGDTTGPRSAKVVLTDPQVEVAVLETARGGIIRGGLGYDWSDVAVITNISEDHLGQDGIDDLEDLALVKALVGEAVHPGGQVVLNADDPQVVALAPRFVRREIVYFSLVADHPVLQQHIADGGRAVYLDGKDICLAKGQEVIEIMSVDQIPATLQGIARHNLQNAMAAMAASFSLGVELQQIRFGLKTFMCNLELNPGRQNFLEIDGVHVLIDYGHNGAAFASTITTLRQGSWPRIIGVAGVPGDRSNASIINAGKVLAGFDYLLIKEDVDLRGRTSGEVAGLLVQGLVQCATPKERYQVILDEIQAIHAALHMAEPGDLVVIFYEKLPRVLEALAQRRPEPVYGVDAGDHKQMIG